MKFPRFGLALAAAVLASTAAAQQKSAPSQKIGYVNPDRVMRDSRASQQAQNALENEFKKREQEILSGPKDQVERRRAALLEEIAGRRDEALKQVLERVNAAIKRVAEGENMDAVFAEAAYAGPRIDITAQVIKALDAGR